MTKSDLPTKDQTTLINNRDQVAKALEILFAAGYVSRRKLYLENFLRGMAFSAGGVIGATVLVGLLLWALSFFDQVPLLGPVIDKTRHSLRQDQP